MISVTVAKLYGFYNHEVDVRNLLNNGSRSIKKEPVYYYLS